MKAADVRVLHQSLRNGNVGLDWEDVLIGIMEQDPRGSAGVTLPPRDVGIETVVQGLHLVPHAETVSIGRAKIARREWSEKKKSEEKSERERERKSKKA